MSDDKPDQIALKKLRELSRELDVARRSQRMTTTELMKSRRVVAPRKRPKQR